jgi:hypothetical protein
MLYLVWFLKSKADISNANKNITVLVLFSTATDLLQNAQTYGIYFILLQLSTTTIAAKAMHKHWVKLLEVFCILTPILLT